MHLHIFPGKCGLETGRKFLSMSRVQGVSTVKRHKNPFRYLVQGTHKGICSSFPLWISPTYYDHLSFGVINEWTRNIWLSGSYPPAHGLGRHHERTLGYWTYVSDKKYLGLIQTHRIKKFCHSLGSYRRANDRHQWWSFQNSYTRVYQRVSKIIGNRWFSPSNSEIDAVVDDLHEIVDRFPRRFRICANAAVVVSELFRILRFLNLAVEFNDIRVLWTGWK